MSDEIGRSVSNRIMLLQLNRPGKANALTPGMYRALQAALIDASSDSGVDLVLFCANGTSYCAGNDIEDFLGSKRSTHAIDFIRTLVGFNKPLVAAVQGHAVGIGMTMLLHFDLVYAAPDTRFRLPFVDLGLVPEAGSSLLLPARIGHARAAAMLMLGEPLSAEQALAAGLINAIVAPQSLLEQARAKALALQQKPRATLAATRALLRGDDSDLRQRIDAEAELFVRARQSPEAREALRAFLEKRAPVFPPAAD